MTDSIDMVAVMEAAKRWREYDYCDDEFASMDAWPLAEFAARILDMPPEVRETVEEFVKPKQITSLEALGITTNALLIARWFATQTHPPGGSR